MKKCVCVNKVLFWQPVMTKGSMKIIYSQFHIPTTRSRNTVAIRRWDDEPVGKHVASHVPLLTKVNSPPNSARLPKKNGFVFFQRYRLYLKDRSTLNQKNVETFDVAFLEQVLESLQLMSLLVMLLLLKLILLQCIFQCKLCLYNCVPDYEITYFGILDVSEEQKQT